MENNYKGDTYKKFRRIHHLIKELEDNISCQFKAVSDYVDCVDMGDEYDAFDYEGEILESPDVYRIWAKTLTENTKEILEYVTNSERDEAFILGKLKGVSDDLYTISKNMEAIAPVLNIEGAYDVCDNYCQKVLSCKEDIDCTLAFFEAYPSMTSAAEQPQSPNKGGGAVSMLPTELNTAEAKKLFERAIKAGLMSKADNGYKWEKTAALFGYFADKVSDHLNIRPYNNNIPWRIFKAAFVNVDSTLIETARQKVNDYKNKGLPEPEGFLEINKLLK